MPASLPGATLAQNQGNPSQGGAILMDPLSGPKGSPLDKDQAGNCSTGAICTGIGMSCRDIISAVAPASINKAGFDDDQIPGGVQAQGAMGQAQNVCRSWMMYIGGGRMQANADPVDKLARPFIPNPYTAGVFLLNAGGGGSRDAGAGPAFTGFSSKMVTAAAGVAIGAAIEAGFINRSPRALLAGESSFGSSAAASAAPA